MSLNEATGKGTTHTHRTSTVRFAARAVSCAFLFVYFPAVVYCQNAYSTSTGVTELGAFVGASYSHSDAANVAFSSLRAMGGGNISYSLTSWLLPYAEVSYFPGIQRVAGGTFGGISNVTHFEVPLYDIHGGVHVRFPIGSRNFIPYGVFGAGVVYSNFKGSSTTIINGVTQTSQITSQETDFALNFGGGLRTYVNDRWGFRVEGKVYRPVTGQNQNFFGKVEFGVFYQFHR